MTETKRLENNAKAHLKQGRFTFGCKDKEHSLVNSPILPSGLHYWNVCSTAQSPRKKCLDPSVRCTTLSCLPMPPVSSGEPSTQLLAATYVGQPWGFQGKWVVSGGRSIHNDLSVLPCMESHSHYTVKTDWRMSPLLSCGARTKWLQSLLQWHSEDTTNEIQNINQTMIQAKVYLPITQGGAGIWSCSIVVTQWNKKRFLTQRLGLSCLFRNMKNAVRQNCNCQQIPMTLSSDCFWIIILLWDLGLFSLTAITLAQAQNIHEIITGF